jgi:hypothetical protein
MLCECPLRKIRARMLRLGNYAYIDIALLIGVHVMMMICNLWSLTRTDRDRVQGPVMMQVEIGRLGRQQSKWIS